MCYLSISFAVRSSLTLAELSSAATRGFFSGTGLHANDLGRLYAAAYALLLFAWHESRNATFRLACLATMGVVITALVFTFSRGAFLGFIVVNGLFFLWRFNMKTAALALLGGVMLLAVLPDAVFQRAMFGVGTDTNTVTAGRLDDIWIPLLPEIFKSPLWGSGLGSIMWSDAMRRGTMAVVEHPHNAYIEAFVDVGIIGIALIFAFYAHVWKRFRELGSNPYLSPELRGFFKGGAAALIAFFVTGVAGSSFAPRPEWAFLWLAIGMMYGQLARRPDRGHA
jgi:O-antigen ligase